jgi:hypothetical protein
MNPMTMTAISILTGTGQGQSYFVSTVGRDYTQAHASLAAIAVVEDTEVENALPSAGNVQRLVTRGDAAPGLSRTTSG